MNYRDLLITQLRRKIKRQETNLSMTQEHLKEIEDLRDNARRDETKK